MSRQTLRCLDSENIKHRTARKEYLTLLCCPVCGVCFDDVQIPAHLHHEHTPADFGLTPLPDREDTDE
jgi:hypothetical protein